MVGSYAGHDTILINSSFYFIRNSTFLAAENRDFGRFVTNWYNVQCKHTRFFEFWDFWTRVFGKKLGFGGLGLGLGVAKVRLPAHWCIFCVFPCYKKQTRANLCVEVDLKKCTFYLIYYHAFYRYSPLSRSQGPRRHAVQRPLIDQFQVWWTATTVRDFRLCIFSDDENGTRYFTYGKSSTTRQAMSYLFSENASRKKPSVAHRKFALTGPKFWNCICRPKSYPLFKTSASPCCKQLKTSYISRLWYLLVFPLIAWMKSARHLVSFSQCHIVVSENSKILPIFKSVIYLFSYKQHSS